MGSEGHPRHGGPSSWVPGTWRSMDFYIGLRCRVTEDFGGLPLGFSTIASWFHLPMYCLAGDLHVEVGHPLALQIQLLRVRVGVLSHGIRM